MNPFVTIVFLPENYDNLCRLLVLYENGEFYYSNPRHYKSLIIFKKSPKIVRGENKIIVCSKNEKQTLEIHK